MSHNLERCRPHERDIIVCTKCSAIELIRVDQRVRYLPMEGPHNLEIQGQKTPRSVVGDRINAYDRVLQKTPKLAGGS